MTVIEQDVWSHVVKFRVNFYQNSIVISLFISEKKTIGWVFFDFLFQIEQHFTIPLIQLEEDKNEEV